MEAQIIPSVARNTAADSKLKELFIEQLQELYWAEKKLAKALDKMQKAAFTPELKEAFSRHEQLTREQATRLEKVFKSLGEPPAKSKSPAMSGIISELEDVLDDTEGNDCCQRDVALILVAQLAEHHEIASYGGLVQLAKTLGFEEAKQLLDQTLQEEKQTDTLLTLIAESGINQKAAEE